MLPWLQNEMKTRNELDGPTPATRKERDGTFTKLGHEVLSTVLACSFEVLVLVLMESPCATKLRRSFVKRWKATVEIHPGQKT